MHLERDMAYLRILSTHSVRHPELQGGIIYKTMDTALNWIVAIKMLKSALSTDEAFHLRAAGGHQAQPSEYRLNLRHR